MRTFIRIGMVVYLTAESLAPLVSAENVRRPSLRPQQHQTYSSQALASPPFSPLQGRTRRNVLRLFLTSLFIRSLKSQNQDPAIHKSIPSHEFLLSVLKQEGGFEGLADNFSLFATALAALRPEKGTEDENHWDSEGRQNLARFFLLSRMFGNQGSMRYAVGPNGWTVDAAWQDQFFKSIGNNLIVVAWKFRSGPQSVIHDFMVALQKDLSTRGSEAWKALVERQQQSMSPISAYNFIANMARHLQLTTSQWNTKDRRFPNGNDLFVVTEHGKLYLAVKLKGVRPFLFSILDQNEFLVRTLREEDLPILKKPNPDKAAVQYPGLLAIGKKNKVATSEPGLSYQVLCWTKDYSRYGELAYILAEYWMTSQTEKDLLDYLEAHHTAPRAWGIPQRNPGTRWLGASS